MKIILTAERNGLPAGRFEFEMSDEILDYEKQRVYQMVETINGHTSKLVESVIKDNDLTKKVAELNNELQKYQPDTEKYSEIKKQLSDVVEQKIVNIFGEIPKGSNGEENAEIEQDKGKGDDGNLDVQTNQPQTDQAKGEESVDVNKK